MASDRIYLREHEVIQVIKGVIHLWYSATYPLIIATFSHYSQGRQFYALSNSIWHPLRAKALLCTTYSSGFSLNLKKTAQHEDNHKNARVKSSGSNLQLREGKGPKLPVLRWDNSEVHSEGPRVTESQFPIEITSSLTPYVNLPSSLSIVSFLLLWITSQMNYAVISPFLRLHFQRNSN